MALRRRQRAVHAKAMPITMDQQDRPLETFSGALQQRLKSLITPTWGRAEIGVSMKCNDQALRMFTQGLVDSFIEPARIGTHS